MLSRFASPRPVTSAVGTLGELPLAHALVYVRAKRLSGVLDLHAPGHRHGWVVTSRGQVVSVTTTPTVARFGTVVYESGLCDAATVDETAKQSTREKRPQADILLDRGVLTRAQYRTVLEEQMRRRVHHLFTYPDDTKFIFREGRTSRTLPEVVIDVLAPVWRGLTDSPPTSRMAEMLELVGDRPLRLLNEAAVEHAELSRAELAVCETLASGPRTLAELRASSKMPRERVDLLAYLLVIARCVEVEGPGKTPAASSAMWVAANVRPLESGETTARKSAPPLHRKGPTPHMKGPLDLGASGIRRRAASLEDESPYEALGLPEGASAEAARAAFFRLGRSWHPDRLPPSLAEVRPEVTRIFYYMTDAHRLLTEPPPRDKPPRK